MKILESAENYLETILILEKRNGSVKSIDIANELNFSKASVSVAMKNLKENEYITMASDHSILLTPKGQLIAEKMYERHVLITNFLMNIGVSKEIASQDACKIEHIISSETFERLKLFNSQFSSK